MTITREGARRSQVVVDEPAPATAPRLRRQFRAVFTQWGLDAEVTQDALAVIDELVSNVIDHARTAFRLAVEMTDTGVAITVTDGSTDPATVRPFDPIAVRGRGLQIVDAVASRWGCEVHAATKTVWARLDSRSPPSRRPLVVCPVSEPV